MSGNISYQDEPSLFLNILCYKTYFSQPLDVHSIYNLTANRHEIKATKYSFGFKGGGGGGGGG